MTWVREEAVGKVKVIRFWIIFKVDLTDVADGPRCKTKGGVKVDSLV